MAGISAPASTLVIGTTLSTIIVKAGDVTIDISQNFYYSAVASVLTSSIAISTINTAVSSIASTITNNIYGSIGSTITFEGYYNQQTISTQVSSIITASLAIGYQFGGTITVPEAVVPSYPETYFIGTQMVTATTGATLITATLIVSTALITAVGSITGAGTIYNASTVVGTVLSAGTTVTNATISLISYTNTLSASIQLTDVVASSEKPNALTGGFNTFALISDFSNVSSMRMITTPSQTVASLIAGITIPISISYHDTFTYNTLGTVLMVAPATILSNISTTGGVFSGVVHLVVKQLT